MFSFSEIPPTPGQPPLAEADRNLVMHVELPILVDQFGVNWMFNCNSKT